MRHRGQTRGQKFVFALAIVAQIRMNPGKKDVFIKLPGTENFEKLNANVSNLAENSVVVLGDNTSVYVDFADPALPDVLVLSDSVFRLNASDANSVELHLQSGSATIVEDISALSKSPKPQFKAKKVYFKKGGSPRIDLAQKKSELLRKRERMVVEIPKSEDEKSAAKATSPIAAPAPEPITPTPKAELSAPVAAPVPKSVAPKVSVDQAEDVEFKAKAAEAKAAERRRLADEKREKRRLAREEAKKLRAERLAREKLAKEKQSPPETKKQNPKNLQTVESRRKLRPAEKTEPPITDSASESEGIWEIQIGSGISYQSLKGENDLRKLDASLTAFPIHLGLKRIKLPFGFDFALAAMSTPLPGLDSTAEKLSLDSRLLGTWRSFGFGLRYLREAVYVSASDGLNEWDSSAQWGLSLSYQVLAPQADQRFSYELRPIIDLLKSRFNFELRAALQYLPASWPNYVFGLSLQPRFQIWNGEATVFGEKRDFKEKRWGLTSLLTVGRQF